jgi:hypothetical protein
MSFLNPLLLIGCAAAVLPLLIYLLTRDRVSVVPFSTLRFFAGNSAKLVQRKKWLETLLLILRCGLCALIAVAFARPLLAKKAAGEGGSAKVDDAVVLLVDISQSMSRAGAWEQAVAAAEKVLADSNRAAFSLVAFDQTAQTLTTWTDATATAAKLKTLKPQPTGTDLVAAFRKADELLADVAAESKRVVLVSDLQKVALKGSGVKLAPGVAVQVEPVTADTAAAVAIVDASLPQSLVNDKQPHAVTVRLVNAAKDAPKEVALELALAGQEKQARTVTVPPEQAITVSFRPSFATEGDHPGTLSIKDGQSLYLNPHVLPRIGTVILAADDEASRRGGAAFFLARAIRPSDASPFDVKVIGASAATPKNLETASVVIVCDVPTVPPAMKEALVAFRQRGGGLLLMPGGRTTPAGFAEAFGDVAPCQLRRVIAAADTRKDNAKALITKVDLQHPILEIFNRPHSGNFSAVALERYWEVADSQLARVPMRLDDGRPFMLEKNGAASGGACVLVVSSPDPTWSNFSQRAIFLPLLHQTLRYLAVRAERPTTYTVGDVLPVGPGRKLKDPDGQTHEGASLIAAQPGHYVLSENDQIEMTYAVNTPLNEADLTPIPPAELKAAVETPGDAVAGGNVLQAGGASRELWMWVIGLSLVLVIVELLVSNKVPRH